MFQFWLNIIHMFLCGLIRPLHGAMIKGHEDPLVNVMRWRFARKDQRIRPSINRKPMSTSSNIFCLGLRRTFQPLAEYSSAKSFEKLSFSLGWFDILLAGDGRMSSRWGLGISLQKLHYKSTELYADFKGGRNSRSRSLEIIKNHS